MGLKDFIVDTDTAKVDGKNRFTMPIFTNRKPGDVYIFVYNFEKEVVEVYSRDYYLNIAQQIIDSKDLDFILEHSYALPRLQELLDMALFTAEVDKQCRISVNMKILQLFGFKSDSEIVVRGRGNYLELFPSEISFLDYLKKIIIKKKRQLSK